MPHESSFKHFFQGSQDLVIENEADVGQSEVMNSDVVVFSGVSAIERRYVFDSLIPGMRYNIIIQLEILHMCESHCLRWPF